MHTPTDVTRASVRALASVGINQIMIAKYVGINCPKTLRKHYRIEIDQSCTSKVAKVAGRLFEAAMDGNVPAMIFIMKTQGFWREVKEEDSQEVVDEKISKIQIVNAVKPEESKE